MPLPPEFHELARKVSNWGRWGDEDERGTLNLLTSEAVRRGVASVRAGRRFSLALALSSDGPQAGLVPGRDNPTHTVFAVNEATTGDPDAFCTSDDRLDVALQSATHWDALAHVSQGGQLYNGFPADSVTGEGAARCGIDKIGPIAGRGVLLDIARARAVDRLDPGHALTVEDLEAAEDLAATTVEPGDLLLLRTGQMQHFHAGDRVAYAFPSPGPSMATAVWFRERDIAAVATDNLTFEVFPGEREDLFLPVHLLHLVHMGLTQGQNFDLEALAADCADDGQYTFLLEATPEPVAGGIGGLVTPVVIK